ncbi:hypothetical protein [Caulobacter sp. UNC279MFTsu5.1]|uniref:hypothetical protein n=1 Tax=Caulobacter sp. UNC279MFTsu5.1 TaxID=1502775 RepID=UPI0008E8B8B1|nr:hypothetical protein [Caulobacter sp. UNC279MFTsu5.1]SFI55515.1 hypothetical protein SAMN02799626_00113 [Caulobacter sp. UNC279MFTsu5.1]
MKLTPADIIALFALGIAAWSLVQTIRFNRRQEEFEKTNQRLNLLLIEKERAESSDQIRADIGASFYRAGKNNYRLKIFNRGKAAAWNLRVEIVDDGDLLIESEFQRKFPVPILEPQTSVELIAAAHFGSASRAHLKAIWDDASGTQRSKELHPTL